MNVTHPSMHSLDTSTGCLAAANAMSSRKSLVAPELTNACTNPDAARRIRTDRPMTWAHRRRRTDRREYQTIGYRDGDPGRCGGEDVASTSRQARRDGFAHIRR